MAKNQKVTDTGLIDRILELKRYFDLNQDQIAQVVGAKQTNVSAALRGDRGIPKHWVALLAKRYSTINEQWLKTGEGDMFVDDVREIEAEDQVRSTNKIVSRGNGKALSPEEVEKMLIRLSYRIGELEFENRDREKQITKQTRIIERQQKYLEEIEMWREQMTLHISRVLRYLKEIDELKKSGKWPK